MWPWILGSAGVGAALGGIQGYQQSGGDLGATLKSALGGGLAGGATAGLGGIAGGAATRMAGQALEPLATGSSLSALKTIQGIPILGKLLPETTTLAEQVGLGSKITEAAQRAQAANVPKIAGLGANLATQAIAAPVLGGIAGGVTNLAGQAISAPLKAAGNIAGAAGVGQGKVPDPANYPYARYAVPGVDQYGNVHPYGLTPWDQLNPLGGPAGQRTGERLEQDVQLEGLKKYLGTTVPVIEGEKKADFLRNMAAAGIRSNIATQSEMLRQAQLGAQQQGQTALQGTMQALGQTYQYS